MGINCDYSWVFPLTHCAETDETDEVNIDVSDDHGSIDENAPLASVLLSPKRSSENFPLPNPPVNEELAESLPPVSPPPDVFNETNQSSQLEQPSQPEHFNETQPPSQPEQSEQHSKPEKPSQHSQPEQQHSQTELPSHNLSEQSSQPSSVSSDSPILDPHGFIAPKSIKPSSRRTPARLPDLFLACIRKPTTPTLTTGRPRSSIPVPTTASFTLETENDMETTHDLKRKSSDVSPSRKETTPTEKKKGKK